MPGPDPFEPVPDARPDDRPWPAMTWPPAADARLTGPLVELAPLTADQDVADLFHVLDEDAVWEHLAGRAPNAPEYARMWRQRWAEGRIPWVVRLRRPLAGLEAGSVIGTSSFLNVSAPDSRLEIGSTAYNPVLWGSGVNTDAKLLLLTHAFDVLGAGRVQFMTDVRNKRSQMAIAALGARYEGTLRRYFKRADGTVRDSVLFSVVAEEWPTVREGLEARLRTRLDSIS